jgi:hypothetical protein
VIISPQGQITNPPIRYPANYTLALGVEVSEPLEDESTT